MRKQYGARIGFSLIELLIVIALILIIAGLALPNLMRSKVSANEASAMSTLRTLYGAEQRYSGTYNTFSADLDSLGPPASGEAPSQTSADLVDALLAGRLGGTSTSFVKSGYRFSYTPVGTFPAIERYQAVADPLSRGSTGQRSFFVDQSGTIRSNGSVPATASDSPVM
jgi:prepilin-type N-terminal cleavage/methylation domain-containing protein